MRRGGSSFRKPGREPMARFRQHGGRETVQAERGYNKDSGVCCEQQDEAKRRRKCGGGCSPRRRSRGHDVGCAHGRRLRLGWSCWREVDWPGGLSRWTGCRGHELADCLARECYPRTHATANDGDATTERFSAWTYRPRCWLPRPDAHQSAVRNSVDKPAGLTCVEFPCMSRTARRFHPSRVTKSALAAISRCAYLPACNPGRPCSSPTQFPRPRRPHGQDGRATPSSLA